MKIVITIEIDEQELENLKENEVEEEANPEYTKKTSKYARFFDEGSSEWTKNPEINLNLLEKKQKYANYLLKTKGHLLLNEVYDLLDIPRTEEGEVVGWFFDELHPTGDNYVDFGIFHKRNSGFINGREKIALLDFNVDGNIKNLL